jgi:hypothetical protein
VGLTLPVLQQHHPYKSFSVTQHGPLMICVAFFYVCSELPAAASC